MYAVTENDYAALSQKVSLLKHLENDTLDTPLILDPEFNPVAQPGQAGQMLLSMSKNYL